MILLVRIGLMFAVLCAAVAQAGPKPHILVIHDMEGLAGQDDPYSFLYGNPKYPETRRQLTADVNAVVAGLFAGGAGAVSIADGHGSGNPHADILMDKLDPRAKMVSRPAYFDTYVDLAEPGAFDAVAVVGMHAKSGTGGFAAHTYTIGAQIFINGHSITETELVGYLYGRVGIPVIFASGDDRLAEDLRTMPWIQYVVTKKAKSAASVELYPVAEVHAAMKDKARLAVRKLSSAKVMTLSDPVRVAVRAVPPASLKWTRDIPGLSYSDETLSFTAPDMVAAYKGAKPIVRAMSVAFSAADRAVVNAHPDAKKIRDDQRTELFRRWLDAESGVPQPVVAEPPEPSEHHGFN